MYIAVLYETFTQMQKSPHVHQLSLNQLLALLFQRERSGWGSAEWDCLHQCFKRTGCQKGGTAQVFQDRRPETSMSKSIRNIIVSDLNITYLISIDTCMCIELERIVDNFRH